MKFVSKRCALYLRRSTDEHQMASLDVQREEALRYITANGGIVAPEHVFVDDAVSRAEFKKRPGLIALLNGAEAGAFDAVITRDESRLGGDTFRCGLVVQSILESDVELRYYYTDEKVSLSSAVDKFLVAARGFAAELEREKTSQRTHEHLLTKARRGLVVGGRVYGYKNVEVKAGEQRVRVEYEIDNGEAGIVREMFARYARGEGLRTIVKELNARRVPPPRAGKRGTGSWATSAVWAMLRRERYRGVIVWNQQEKTYRKGTKVRIPRDPKDWVRIDVPHLRIVDDDMWFAAQAQMRPYAPREMRHKGGGRPPRHLLSGFARCGECGGPLSVTNGKQGQENVKVYACSWSRDRGKAVCANTLRRPVSVVNSSVLDWIARNLLSEELIAAVLVDVRDRLAARAKEAESGMPELEREATSLRGEIDRLILALASTDHRPEALVRAVAERQERLSLLEARTRAAKAAPVAVDAELERLEQEARRRIADLRSLIERNPDGAREVMAAVFEQPLKVTARDTAQGKRFWIEGEAVVGRLVGLEAGGCLNEASPAGIGTLGRPANRPEPGGLRAHHVAISA